MSEKFNKSAYIFFVYLDFILKNNIFTINKAIEYLKEKTNEDILRETILKYIRTLKKSGFEFERLNNKEYKLIHIPLLNSKDNQSELNLIRKIAEDDLDISSKNKEKFINKMNIVSKNLYAYSPFKQEQTKKKKILENLKNYCNDERRVYLIVKDKENKYKHFLSEPIEIIINKSRTYFKCYNVYSKKEVKIKTNDIVSTKQTSVKNKIVSQKHAVKIKMFSELAERYKIKKYEMIIKKAPKYLIIESFYNNKKEFFNKMLRYMGKGEIVAPLALRSDFCEYIEKIYQKYN